MYQEFARVYDEFMETISYEEWADHIESIWKKHGVRPEVVLDMACGTGGLAVALSRRGYEMMASDQSVEMLEEAQMKAEESGQSIMLIHQDMRELELFGTVDSILCTCDSLNYILQGDELTQVFSRVNDYLEPGGLFVFDVNTEYKYEHILGDNTYADTYDDAAFIWQNEFHPDTRENEYQVCFFIENSDGSYKRFEELHIQKAYSSEEWKQLLADGDLILEAVYDGLSLDEPKETSERLTFVARKKAERG